VHELCPGEAHRQHGDIIELPGAVAKFNQVLLHICHHAEGFAAARQHGLESDRCEGLLLQIHCVGKPVGIPEEQITRRECFSQHSKIQPADGANSRRGERERAQAAFFSSDERGQVPTVDVIELAATRIQNGEEDRGEHISVALIFFDVIVCKGLRLA